VGIYLRNLFYSVCVFSKPSLTFIKTIQKRKSTSLHIHSKLKTITKPNFPRNNLRNLFCQIPIHMEYLSLKIPAFSNLSKPYDTLNSWIQRKQMPQTIHNKLTHFHKMVKYKEDAKKSTSSLLPLIANNGRSFWIR